MIAASSAWCAGDAVPAVLEAAQGAQAHKSCRQTFLQVIPAAILASADAGVEFKEQVVKPSHHLPDDAHMFADGFALGSAFVLEVSLFTSTLGTATK